VGLSLSSKFTKTKAAFFSSVSVFALAATPARVRAEDNSASPNASIPALRAKDELSVWLEGGISRTGGKSENFGNPPSPVPSDLFKWSKNGAIGFDYQAANSPWHISVRFLYGQRKRKSVFARNGIANVNQQTSGTTGGSGSFGTTITTPTGTIVPIKVPVGVNATGTIQTKTKHWFADFAVGRDFGVGSGTVQVKFGPRIAEIQSKTIGAGNFVAPVSLTPSGAPVGTAPGVFSFEQRSKSLLIGPRLGVDGSAPIIGSWTFDYTGGIAALYGNRSLDVTTGGSAAMFGINDLSNSHAGTVLNIDGQAGVSYWFTKTFKLTMAYRFDGYWNALRTFDASGNIKDENRFYYGPVLRVTAKF
jgi:hypothetical protein